MKEQSVQLSCSIVAANANGRGFSTEQLMDQIRSISYAVNGLFTEDRPLALPGVIEAETSAEPVNWKKSISKTSITCLVCGAVKKVLAPHLRVQHGLTTKQYRQQFGIPAKVSLLSKEARARRQKLAKDRDLGSVLQRARDAKKA